MARKHFMKNFDMNSKSIIVSLIACVVMLLTFAGCKKGPNVQYVEGTVSVDGKLLDECTVTFCPILTSGDDLNSDQRPLTASGVTDEKGLYRLSSLMGGSIGGGTTVGEYKVCIVKKKDTKPKPNIGPGDRLPTSAEMRPIWKYETPEIFEEQGKTPITVTVEKGKNTFHFDLKSDGTFEIK